MSDPAMAASMEADIRARFWVALALTALVVLISPMGEMLGIHLPLSAAVRSWTLLVLTTPIVFWCGWIFVAGAFRSLVSRRLDMSVLIAVGVLAAYVASVYLTIIGSKELFYEAAAMLVTFVLFGHWMEMKSRRGSSDALHALFNLVPPKARVLRNDKEVEVPTSEVVRGDVVVLRPGDRVPVDGEVVEGTTSMDESLVTGESLPVEKKPGGKVVGGGQRRGIGEVQGDGRGRGDHAGADRQARRDSAEFQGPWAAIGRQGCRLPGGSGGRGWCRDIHRMEMGWWRSLCHGPDVRHFGRGHRMP
jgi:Cu2+-exporting ATPase